MPRKRKRMRGVEQYLPLAVALLVLYLAVLIVDALQTWTGRLWLLLIFSAMGIAIALLKRHRQRRKRMRVGTLGEFLTLSSAEFEEAVADILRGKGYRKVSVTGGAGDLQADIVAQDPRRRSVIVQCKRYSPDKKIGSREIQSFIGMAHVHHGAADGMFVTTSSYTVPAIQLAKRHGIRLVDGNELVAMAAPTTGSGRRG